MSVLDLPTSHREGMARNLHGERVPLPVLRGIDCIRESGAVHMREHATVTLVLNDIPTLLPTSGCCTPRAHTTAGALRGMSLADTSLVMGCDANGHREAWEADTPNDDHGVWICNMVSGG